MWTSMWFTSVLAILVADIRTGALQDKEIEPRRCYQCSNMNNTTTCIPPKVSILCPTEQPYCGTVAVGPRFESLLKCLPAFNSTCLMRLASNSTVELACSCPEKLCNAPFSKRIQNELIQFTKTNTLGNSNSSNDITRVFFKNFNFENATDLYKLVTSYEQDNKTSTLSYETVPTVEIITDVLIINSNNSNEIDIPHAEPLKHEATVPPDDDEDESEGSGSYDDTKSLKNTVSAPAAPSSFLPADENKAPPVFEGTLTIIPLITYFIL